MCALCRTHKDTQQCCARSSLCFDCCMTCWSSLLCQTTATVLPQLPLSVQPSEISALLHSQGPCPFCAVAQVVVDLSYAAWRPPMPHAVALLTSTDGGPCMRCSWSSSAALRTCTSTCGCSAAAAWDGDDRRLTTTLLLLLPLQAKVLGPCLVRDPAAISTSTAAGWPARLAAGPASSGAQLVPSALLGCGLLGASAASSYKCLRAAQHRRTLSSETTPTW
jgi:hypothetical protein